RSRSVEAPDRDLRLRCEVEEQGLEDPSAAAAEPVAAFCCIIEGTAMITLRRSHAGAQPMAYGLPELNAVPFARRQQLRNWIVRAGRVDQGSQDPNVAKTLAAGKRVVQLAH